MPAAKKDLPTVPFPSREAFTGWLTENGGSSSGLWVKFAKAGSGHPSVTKAEAVEEALAHGWIDGQQAKFDDEWWLTRFTPRRPRSKWSKVNTEIVARLIENGQMTPAGMREVESAKADGRWAVAYEPQSRATVPEDLQRALDATPAALEFFHTLKGANRYAILYRVGEAKKPETRERRIRHFVAMLAEGKTLH
ncbi:MAG: YdeI/OmpD-associated family protein [Thermoleophilaceae bacterium]